MCVVTCVAAGSPPPSSQKAGRSDARVEDRDVLPTYTQTRERAIAHTTLACQSPTPRQNCKALQAEQRSDRATEIVVVVIVGSMPVYGQWLGP